MESGQVVIIHSCPEGVWWVFRRQRHNSYQVRLMQVKYKI
jgi:hypothetical protein